MLTPQQVEEFQTNGYLLGGRVLRDEEVDHLGQEIFRVIDQQKSSAPQPVRISSAGTAERFYVQIVNIWEASPAYRDLLFHPTIAEEVDQLTAASQLRVWHDQVQYKPPEKGRVNMWHQDWPYWGILSGPHQVTAWIAMDDVDESNGCMSMVAGSHRWGNQIQFLHTLKQFEDMPASFDGKHLKVERRPVKRGHVHYHHALTWHGSCSNESQRPRRALAIHYMTQETRYKASGGHLMKPFVEVADGEVLQGPHFPLVWERGQVLKAPRQ